MWKKAYFEQKALLEAKKKGAVIPTTGLPATQLPDHDPEDPSWRILGGVVLERPPLVAGEMEPWEAEYAALQKTLDEKRCVRVPDELMPYYEDPNATRKFDEEKEKKKKTYCPAKVTADDRSNNLHSSNRKLQNSLFLIVKHKRGRYQWNFPQAALEGSESIREAGERALRAGCGHNVRSFFFGPAPIGVYLYKYPEGHTKNAGFQGNKAFYQHALYFGGEINIDKDVLEDYAWVTKADLPKYFDPELLALTDKMLFSQNWPVKTVDDYEWDESKGIFKGHIEWAQWMKPRYLFEKAGNKIEWDTGNRADMKARQAQEALAKKAEFKTQRAARTGGSAPTSSATAAAADAQAQP